MRADRRSEPRDQVPRHPGHFIKNVLLRNREIGVADLSAETGLPVGRLVDLIDGKTRLTLDDARLLGRVMGSASLTLLRLQAVRNFYDAEHRPPRESERESLFADVQRTYSANY